MPWNEKVIEESIIDNYGWELAADTTSSWRIGDGTAPFYNFVYMSLAGFTENDSLRSNQIRTGQLTRSEAFIRLKEDNQTRLESLSWYFDRVGIDASLAISRINKYKTDALKNVLTHID